MLEDRKLLDAVTRAQTSVVGGVLGTEVFEELLAALLDVTDSEYGFIGGVERDAEGQPRLRTRAITDISWNEETRRFYEEGAPEGLVFTNLDTLFGRVMVTGQPVISNAPATDPRRGGLPPGHPPLNAFLGLPLHFGGQLIGMVGCANRDGGYDQALIDYLQPYLITGSNVLQMAMSEEARQRTAALFEESNARSQAIIDSAMGAIITIDHRGCIEDVNPATQRLFLYSRDELIGRNVSTLMPMPHRAQHDDYIARYLDSGAARIIGQGREVEATRKDGTSFLAQLEVHHITVGGRDLFTGIVSDISVQRAAEQRLQQLNLELSQRIDELAVVNRHSEQLGRLSNFLQACQDELEVGTVVEKFGPELLGDQTGGLYLLGADRELTLTSAWGELSVPAEALAVQDCWALRLGEPHAFHIDGNAPRCPHLDPSVQHSQCVPMITQEGVAGLLVAQENPSDTADGDFDDWRREHHREVMREIADRCSSSLVNLGLRRRLREDAIRDPLTRLYNRRHLQGVLRGELRRARRTQTELAVIMLDIDEFKPINDNHGHDVGDLVLQAVASVLAGGVREEDLVCRWGGEEFVLVLPTAGPADAARRAETLRQSLGAHAISSPGAGALRVTGSFGVACFPKHGEDMECLIAAADRALYAAKHAGRDQVVVASEPS